jgi:hypothetical protein
MYNVICFAARLCLLSRYKLQEKFYSIVFKIEWILLTSSTKEVGAHTSKIEKKRAKSKVYVVLLCHSLCVFRVIFISSEFVDY